MNSCCLPFKICFKKILRPLLKVLVLIVCWLCDLSGILDEAYLSLWTAFSSKPQPPMVCTNLLGYFNCYVKFTELPTTIFMTKMTFTNSDKSTRKVNLKVTFLLQPGFPRNWITTERDMSCPLWFNFISIGQVLKKLL